MRVAAVISFKPAVLLCFALMGNLLCAQPTGEAATPVPSINVSIFFGSNKVMNVMDLKTNALFVLKGKNYTVPQDAECVMNVSVEGKEAGCAVMFFDSKKQWQYFVVFNDKAEVKKVYSGAIRHRTVGPNDPRPKVPEGAVEVKP